MAACYMQIPIHFNGKGGMDNFPRSQINWVTLNQIEQYKKDKASKLHDILIDRTKAIKNLLEDRQNKPVRLCLVEVEEIAYFFEGDRITFNSSIPSCGTLVTQGNKIIGMNAEHFKIK